MKKNIVYYWVIIFVSVISFVNTLNNDFVNYDDTTYIINNPRIRGEKISDAFALFNPFPFLKGTLPKKLNEYLPVRDLSFWFDYQLGGLNPTIFHLTNLIIYVLLCVSFYSLCVKIIKNRAIALISIIFYSIHPLHTENVAWISARKDLLSALFYVLSFIAFVNYSNAEDKKNRVLWYSLSVLLFLSGWLTKALVITLPAIFILYGIYERKKVKKIILETLIFWILDIMFFLVNTVIVKGVTPLLKGPAPGLFSGINYIGYYIHLFLFPFFLVPVREPLHTFTLFNLFLSILLLIFLLLLTIKYKKLLFFLLFFIINILPVLNLTVYANYNVQDRYMIISSAGLSMFIAVIIHQMRNENFKKIILVCFSAIFILLTIRQNTIWQTGITLWRHNLKFYPDSSIAHLNLGSALSDNNYVEAEKEYWIVINSPHASPEVRSYAFYNLGNLKIKSGELKEALVYFEKALSDSPEPGRIHRILGGIYVKLKQPEKAIEHYELSLKLEPYQPDRYLTEEILNRLKLLPPPERKP